MALRTTRFMLVVLFWSVKVLLGQKGWNVMYTSKDICAVKGSTVNLICTYSYPKDQKVTSTFWFTTIDNKGKFADLRKAASYKDRVKYKESMNEHTLIISALRQSDSAVYKFRFKTKKDGYYGKPGISLSVSDLQVKFPTTVIEGQGVTLTCNTTCILSGNPTYIWYKNGQSLTIKHNSLNLNTVSSKDTGRYSCAVNGHEDLRSPEIVFTVRYGPKSTSVSVSPSSEIVEGSSVTLTCSSDANPPVNKYTWYKKNETSPKASGQSYSITNIRSEDSGEYYCEAKNEYGCFNSSSVFVDVHYGPKNTTVSVSPSGEIMEGSSVTLTCTSDANPPVNNYTWYKRNVTSPKASGQSYSITNIRSEDSGEYYCEAGNMLRSQNSTSRLISVAGKSGMTAILGVTVFILVLLPCVSGFIWYRKKASKSTLIETDTSNIGQRVCTHVYDTIPDTTVAPPAAPTEDTDKQKIVYYSSIHHINQEVPLYSTVQLPQPQTG
ncbi:hypothetical protein UPYG_G00062530 [Umbra pygmaea]|uniref:Ig-like domain-containing protein n=1 Tax=Umbra pygmaea TaxID=75934 RepID=A0ABD0XZ65_UMBPY